MPKQMETACETNKQPNGRRKRDGQCVVFIVTLRQNNQALEGSSQAHPGGHSHALAPFALCHYMWARTQLSHHCPASFYVCVEEGELIGKLVSVA